MSVTNIIYAKFEDLRSVISSLANSPGIIAICEIWLKPAHSSSYIYVPGYYASFRCDRSDGHRGGGIVVWFSYGLSGSILALHTHRNFICLVNLDFANLVS